MASSYKTPGVYIEEISSLPASVAQVETAIPAFIGYTEYHKDTDGTSLLNVPTRISSLVEYQEKYGGAPPLAVDSVSLNALSQVTGVATKPSFFTYDSLRMFWANGGGDCYIVSVGTYKTGGVVSTPAAAKFLNGLAALKKADEPTLLLAPDAVLMSLHSDIDSVYQAMLSHANYMQDRFCVFDMKEVDNAVPTLTFDTAVNNFRSGIGVNYLKYGACYGPWIKASLPKVVKYSDIKGKILQSGATVPALKSLADQSSDEAKFTADRLDNLTKDQALISSSLATYLAAQTPNDKTSLKELFETHYGNLSAAATKANLTTLLNFYLGVLLEVDKWMHSTGTNPFTDISTAYAAYSGSLTGGKTYLHGYSEAFVNSSFKFTAEKVIAYGLEANADIAAATFTQPIAATYNYTVWSSIFTSTPTASTIFANTPAGTGAVPVAARIATGLGALQTLGQEILAGVDYIVSGAASTSSAVETAALQQIPVFKSIVDYIAKGLSVMPPSGAIVGVYAATDRNRGVWKAPANVSLASTAGVNTLISHERQESLNVDTNSGKSINAIRPFTGKGILVWGARTLAGNDNEWRYVPVRRLYIMVEESIKKATEFVVFEPNDKNTWVRMKGMISNFLTELWRAGALAGAKPEQSFFVNVGLGETMTPLDILEGRMIVEIGLAAVRPAEFIILRFYHKLQES